MRRLPNMKARRPPIALTIPAWSGEGLGTGCCTRIQFSCHRPPSKYCGKFSKTIEAAKLEEKLKPSHQLLIVHTRYKTSAVCPMPAFATSTAIYNIRHYVFLFMNSGRKTERNLGLSAGGFRSWKEQYILKCYVLIQWWQCQYTKYASNSPGCSPWSTNRRIHKMRYSYLRYTPYMIPGSCVVCSL